MKMTKTAKRTLAWLLSAAAVLRWIDKATDAGFVAWVDARAVMLFGAYGVAKAIAKLTEGTTDDHILGAFARALRIEADDGPRHGNDK